ncbi:MAG: hypothetical protein HY329_12480 [Chloroflexi bacterium]|nr:hypothetical protein [Chloroflexota bacterium]
MGTVVGVFNTRHAADRAVDGLMQQGFTRNDISVIARGREGVSTFDPDYRWDDFDDNDHATASGGAVAGGITGLLVGAGALLIPGVGPIFAAGPLAAGIGALMGAVAGAAIGGVAGGLIQAGVPEEEARYYEDRFREGGYLVTVSTSREDVARSVLASHGAHIRGYEGSSMWEPRSTARDMYAPRSGDTIDRDAGAPTVGAVAGGVTGAVAGGALAGAAAGGLTGPAGAAIGAAVGALGGAVLGGAADWDTVAPEYRADFERRYPGARWEDYETSYRYGWDAALDRGYHGREWDEVESDLGTRWSSEYGRRASWQDTRERAREAWTRARSRRTT